MQRFLLLWLWLVTGFAWSAPLVVGPELVTDGSFETVFLPDWTRFGWGHDAPPHSGSRAVFTIFDVPDVSSISQVISGLVPGESYLISLWVGNSFQSRVPMSNGVSVQFGTDQFRAFDVGEAYTELTFSSVAVTTSQTLSLSGFNDPRAFFLDDVSVRQLAEGAPELNASQAGGALWVICLLLLALGGSRRASRKGLLCSARSASLG